MRLKSSQKLPQILIGIAITLLFAAHAAHWITLPFIERLDGQIYDARLRMTMPGGLDPRVVIVDIDEASLKEREEGGEGRWPWSRDRLALLLDQLFDKYQVSAVGFDVIFSERDESSGLRNLEETAKNHPKIQAELAQIKQTLDYDSRFAQSMKNRPVVLGFSFLNDPQHKGQLPRPVFNRTDLPDTLVDPMIRSGVTANLALLQSQAADGGHINPIVDEDGVIRRIPMLIAYKNGYYQSLGLAITRTLLGGLPLQGILEPGATPNTFGGLQALDVGGATLPVDPSLGAYIPFRGGYKSFEYISAADVIRGTVPAEILLGKIILVGTTAPGLLDLRVTPVSNLYPGVEIHANLISGMLDGTIKQSPIWAATINLGLVLLAGLILALMIPWLGLLWASLAALAAVGTMIGLNTHVYAQGIVLPLAALLLTITLIYAFNIAYGYLVESRTKRQITGLFGQYVPPELVDEMAKDPANYSMEGESRELTILFSDVRGFTTISESLDAKTLSQFINAFLTPFSRIIYGHRGTIDKYMGDCIMAFWGAPLSDEDHARHGVESAFAMLKAVDELNFEFAKRGWPCIKVGIGLNSGRVNVGNMGSDIRLAYTVMGDAVNLASRLEGITKEYGALIVIGEETQKLLPDLIVRELDRVRVKGKDEAVTIYEPLGFSNKDGQQLSNEMRAALTIFEQALQAYRNQNWELAESLFRQLMTQYPQTGDVLYPLYLDRIQHLRANPPGPGWDGAYTFTTK